MGGDVGRDFFISYTGSDQSWAEWIAVQLESAGYSTVLQAFDFRTGSDFIHEMQIASSTAHRTIAVLSNAYFDSKFSESEWRAAFAKDPSGSLRLLLPVRVEACQPPGLLKTRVYVDLIDTDEATCRTRLLAAVSKDNARPTAAPFPGSMHPSVSSHPFPGPSRALNNLPPRNRSFTGRDAQLNQIHSELFKVPARVLPTVAVHGLGGCGKTALALEYAYRFQSDYKATWWIPAENSSAIAAALAAFAVRQGIPESTNQSLMIAKLFDILLTETRWLLIYDNAENPAEIAPLVPQSGGGHVLVTSRWHAWRNHATPFQLGALERAESIAFLRRRTGGAAKWKLNQLAETLGDLPLALAESASYLEETSEGIDDYLELVGQRFRELYGLDGSHPSGNDLARIAGVWSITMDRVKQEEPGAEALVNLLAFMAPEIPRNIEGEFPEMLPDGLAQVVTDRLTYNRVLAAIARYSLVTLTSTTISTHRLVKAVIQSRLDPATELKWAAAAVDLVWDLFPEDPSMPLNWPRCELLLPQVLEVTAHAKRLQVDGWSAGHLLHRTSIYLRRRGLCLQAEPLARQAILFKESLGLEDLESAFFREELGRVLYELDDYPNARLQLEHALRIGENELGVDSPDLADIRGNLGLVLGHLNDLSGARDHLERALANPRTTYRMFNDQITDIAALHSSLGVVMARQGDLVGARAELERALAIADSMRVPDDLGVVITRRRLSKVLRDSGDLPAARAELKLALGIGKATLGSDHPEVIGIRKTLRRWQEQ